MLRASLAAALTLALLGCADGEELTSPGGATDDHGVVGIVVLHADDLRGRPVVAVEARAAFRLVGLRWDTEGGADARLEVRARAVGGAYGAWRAVEVTWAEGPAFDGAWSVDAEADALEIRAATSVPLTFLAVDLLDFARPPAGSLDAPEARGFALAPPGLVEGRGAWGARPSRCAPVQMQARTLTVADNGIGMSRDDVVGLIGTIARSGSAEVLAISVRRAGLADRGELRHTDVGEIAAA